MYRATHFIFFTVKCRFAVKICFAVDVYHEIGKITQTLAFCTLGVKFEPICTCFYALFFGRLTLLLCISWALGMFAVTFVFALSRIF